MATLANYNSANSKEDQALLDRLFRMRDIATDAVVDRHTNWRENEDYYLGIQWAEDRLDKLATWRSAPVYNVIFQAVEHIHSLVTDQRPKAFAYNRAGGTERIANLLSSHLEQLHVDLELEYLNSLKWKDKMLFGTGIWKIFWNSDEKMLDTVRVSPDRIFPDPLATDFTDARYCLELMDLPISDVLETYPDKFDEIKASHSNEFKDIFDRKNDEVIRSARVNVWQCWYKDTAFDEFEVGVEEMDKKDMKKRQRKYPNGRMTTFVGDVILEDMKNPYEFTGKDKVFPYVRDVLIQQLNEFWGISLVDVMKFPQEELNELEAQIFDNIKSVVNALTVAAEGALDVDAFVNAPGSVLEVQTDGTQPIGNVFARIPGVNIASDVFRFRELKVEELMKMAGITDTLTGNVGASQRPGSVRAAFEASMSRLREMIRNDNRALSKMGEKQIDLMQQKYDVEKFIAVSNQWDDIASLQSDTVQAEVRKAMQDPKVMREFQGQRVERQINVPNEQFANEAAALQAQQPEITQDEIRDLLKIDGILEFKDDIRVGKYGYRVDVGPMQARDRESFQNLVIDLLRYGDGNIVDAQAVHEWLELPNKEKMVQRLDLVKRLKQENEQLKTLLQQGGAPQNGQSPQQ